MKSLQQSLLFGACLFLKALFSHLEYALAHWERKRLQHRAVIIFFSSWVFFHFHSRILSRITRLQGKAECIPLIPQYHFHPLYKNLDISRTITAESSPLHIGSIQIRTGNFWFPLMISSTNFLHVIFFSFLQIWSHLLKKSLIEIFIFCTAFI